MEIFMHTLLILTNYNKAVKQLLRRLKMQFAFGEAEIMLIMSCLF